MKGRARKTSRLLRYAADRRSVAFIFVTLALLASPIALGARIHAAWALVFVPVAGTFCLAAGAVAHNYVHVPVFRSVRLNAIFGGFITLAMGHAATEIMLSHVYNHHVHEGGPGDYIRPGIGGEGQGFLRVVRFVMRAHGSITRGLAAEGAPRLPHEPQRRMVVERALLHGVALVLAVLAPRAFFLFILPSWTFGLLAFLVVNFLQHDGCDPNSELDRSNTHRRPGMDWFFFNAGFHTAHHLRPGLHWSELPRYHEERILPRLNPARLPGSLLGHLYRGYLRPSVWPAARALRRAP